MELRQLEIFRALAEELHFTRAAERVHCVQSNVTIQIRALERELGTPLFDRLAKRVALTDAGRRFLPYAERVLSTIEEARRTVSTDSIPAGPLRIGSSESMLTYRLPEVLRTFGKQYPKVELIFEPYLHEGLMRSIESGKLDLVVCMTDALAEERLKIAPLADRKAAVYRRSQRSIGIKKKSRASQPGRPDVSRNRGWLRLSQETRPAAFPHEHPPHEHHRIFERRGH